MLTSKSHITLDIKSINQKKHAYCNAHETFYENFKIRLSPRNCVKKGTD